MELVTEGTDDWNNALMGHGCQEVTFYLILYTLMLDAN
jgi:hypothetical protein